ncbi:hypothetical protein JCM3775_005497 [Rhodotorula graminis]|uniref:Uncharacterized protein n=1 Tax=Rhodotorula graminis (strain WP1) TaxID=578459 RepID=A0A194SAF4_RHOGW|nr:uncharacterized protein RHOBADRAFT_51404 [Rhodotorula graminis WP1]KPV77569.1 hypothetical protein RHOBADRAFT_51404 [Rhodotorula graminis WP1]
MSLRSTVVRLAEHARTPLIRFPDRKSSHAHAPTAHPCAPQSVIDSFSRFQDAQQQNPQLVNSSNSSYGGSPTPGGNPAAARAGSSSSGSGSGTGAGASAGGKGGAVDELPAWLRRTRPEEDEIEAVMSGGASTTPEITRAFKQRWYTPQF